ncbi:MAG: helix-turn-helix domain-containing protein [Muribaculaceae bacterium]
MNINDYAQLLPNAIADSDGGVMFWNIDSSATFLPYALEIDDNRLIAHVAVWQGCVECECDGLTHRVEQKQFATLLDISRFTPLSATSNTRATVIVFTDSFLFRLLGNQPPIPVFFLVKSRRNPIINLDSSIASILSTRMSQVGYCLSDQSHVFRSKMVNCAAWMFLLDLSNWLISSSSASAPRGFGNEGRRMQLFVNFTKMLPYNVAHNRNVTYYTGKLCVTPQYLNRIVKAISGRTAYSWICFTLTGQIANSLVYSGKTVQQVAEQFAFPDQATLTKFFKRQTGMTPTQYIASRR